MKQKSNNHQSGFKNFKLEMDIEILIGTIQDYGEEGSYTEIIDDLLTFAMPEFFASETFMKKHPESRKDLVGQFLLLRSLLGQLQEFVSAHPSTEKIDHLSISN